MIKILSKIIPLPEVLQLQCDGVLRRAAFANSLSDRPMSLIFPIKDNRAEMKEEQYRAIVFADICESTGLFERCGDIEAHRIVAATLVLLSQIVRQYDGQVVKTIGDELMCVFADAAASAQAAHDMQKCVADNALLAKHNIAIRIGLHYGKIICENNDVFGDTVNVAARITNLAGARQIVATHVIADALADTEFVKVRSLGRARLRGKQEAIEIVELVWVQNSAEITTANPVMQISADSDDSYLRLVHKSRTINTNLTLLSSPIRIGRGQNNDLIVNHNMVSRNHASIECRKDYFVFVDRSTNGSYLRIGNDQEYHIHRSEALLRGTGVISLGQNAVDKDSPLLLHYECHVG